MEFLSSLCRWFKTKSAKQNDKKNKIVSERMVFDPLTSEVHPVDRSFFRVNQMPTLVVSTIPEVVLLLLHKKTKLTKLHVKL